MYPPVDWLDGRDLMGMLRMVLAMGTMER